MENYGIKVPFMENFSAMITYINVLAAIGFAISFFLWRQKAKRRPVKCLLKEECNKVLNSKYATFLGLPTEVMGMLYYMAIIIGVETSFLTISSAIIVIIVAGATLALIFSLRQIFIQAGVLRAWCSWCLLTAVINAAIFASIINGLGLEGITFLAEEFRFITLPIHLVTAILALAMATCSDFMFFHFLKDFWISVRESKLLDKISEAIWFLVSLFVVSGAAVYLSDIERYNASSKFQVKMVVVAVIILNGLALNMYLAPKLKHIPFNKRDDHLRSQQAAQIRRARKVMFLLGPVSLVSWYSAMALGFLDQSPFGWDFWQLLGVYAILLTAGMVGGQVMGAMLYKADRKKD